MKIGRTLPPAAAPLTWADLWHGIAGAWSGDRAVRSLEQEIRREFGVPHVFLLSSGKAALSIALAALKSIAEDRHEVVIPAYTCFSVPAAVLKAGLQPVLCDIDPATFDFDYDRLDDAISDRTLCIVAHHLFGIPAAIERLRLVCRRRGIFLVEDAAQAMGVEAGGRRLGTIGDLGIFSLGRGKNITCGSGGIVVTSSAPVAAAIDRQYRRLQTASPAGQLADLVRVAAMAAFIRPRLFWIPAALPFLGLGQTVFPKHIPLRRLSGTKAGLLRNWRRRLAGSNRRRAETATYYHRRLPLKSAPVPSHPYLRVPIVVSSPTERNRVYSVSQQRGLGLSLAYPTPISDIPEIASALGGQQFPSARRVSERVLTLPTHHWLSNKDLQAIAELCRDVCAA